MCGIGAGACCAMGEKTADLLPDDRESLAKMMCLRALKYAMMSFDNNRDTVFDVDEALSFEGHIGPYIQGACVRASNVL